MNWASIKATINSYFGFNFIYVGIIALLIFAVIYLYKQKNVTKKEMIYVGVLAVYIALLIGGTLLNRKIGLEIKKELVLFWSYRQCLAEKNSFLFMQIIYNILVFVLWPILFSKVFANMRKAIWAISSAFLFSASIEVTQLIFKLGLFEFDDMFHNTLGAIIGYYIWVLCTKRQKKGIEE